MLIAIVILQERVSTVPEPQSLFVKDRMFKPNLLDEKIPDKKIE